MTTSLVGQTGPVAERHERPGGLSEEVRPGEPGELARRGHVRLERHHAGPAADSEVGKDLAERTVTLEEILGRSVSLDEVAGALGTAAEKVLGVSLFEGMLEEEETEAVERIMRETKDPVAT